MMKEQLPEFRSAPFRRAVRRVIEPAIAPHGLQIHEPSYDTDVMYVSGPWATLGIQGDWKEQTIFPVLYPTSNWEDADEWLLVPCLGAVSLLDFQGHERPPRVSKTSMQDEVGVERVMREWLPWLDAVAFPRLRGPE